MGVDVMKKFNLIVERCKIMQIMRKLFALMCLLTLAWGGALRAQEQEQDRLDEITLIAHYEQPGKYTLGVTFSGTPGEKFLIEWWDGRETITVENTNEIEWSHDITQETSEATQYDVTIYAINPTGHILSLSIDSVYKYTDLYLKSAPELTALQISHNNFRVLSLSGCYNLKYLDVSHNPLNSYDIFSTHDQQHYQVLQHLICNNTLADAIVLDNLPALETFECSHNSQLTGLSLISMPALETVKFTDNPLFLSSSINNCPSLDSLDFTNNVQLRQLFVENTGLKFLDFSVAPNLETVYCRGNDSLTMLKVNNPVLRILDCDHNRLESLHIDNCADSATVDCSHNRLEFLSIETALANLTCNHNRLTSLRLPSDVILKSLVCDSNGLQLSVLTDLVKQVKNTYVIVPQLVSVLRQVGQTLDLHEEMSLNNERSQWILWDATGNRISDITDIHNDILQYNAGRFSFKKTGQYRIDMVHNSLVFDYSGNSCEAQIFYDVTVVDSVARPVFSEPSGAVKWHTPVSLSTTTSDAHIYYTTDGSVPDSTALLYTVPIFIDDAVTIKAIAIQDTFTSRVATASYTIAPPDTTIDNEHSVLATQVRIYAENKTIHVPETIGEVEVFTAGGQCVYRGSATAIPVKRSGLYVVVAKGGRWKVAVR